MKPVEFKLIMNTSRSAEACRAEIKGSNRQVSPCHFKREVSCEIVEKKKKRKKRNGRRPLPTIFCSQDSHSPSVVANAGGYHVCIEKKKQKNEETGANLCLD